MCTTHKANDQQGNVHKANGPAILAGDSPCFSSLFIYHRSKSKFNKTFAGKDLQNCLLYNILAVQLEQMRRNVTKAYFLCFFMLQEKRI